VDRGAEVEKLKKELAGLIKEAESLERKLATPGFVERAPAAVVDDTRARVSAVAERRQRLTEMLGELGA
jgi:valyl-tRNA synthetase